MEGFIDKQYLTDHPDGKIRLLDGTLLDGYKEDKEKGLVEVFLDDEKTDHMFVTNAHQLFRDRNIILKDSRMFLAPVRVYNNLAYTGRYGFQNATLGVYLEWWANCKSSIIEDPKGGYSLVYFLAGSPLSGMNDCMAIDWDGIKKKVSIRPFFDLWRSFVSINMRYEACKHKYEAYSLEEVINILKDKQKRGECGDAIHFGHYVGKTQNFGDLIRRRQYRKRITDIYDMYWTDRPKTITEFASLLKSKGVEVDEIGTSEKEVEEWLKELEFKVQGKQKTDDYYLKYYNQTKEEYFHDNYNEVSNITAKCIQNVSEWPRREEYPELEIGKIYDVSHIGVFRSFTKIILREFGDKEYNAVCFEIFENGEPINDNEYTQDPRFEAPYLRKWLKK